MSQAGWFEVDLAASGTPATITSDQFAVAICFLPQDDPCMSWGLGTDEGPAVSPDGGVVYLSPGLFCFDYSCIESFPSSPTWCLLSAWTDRNWIMRASGAQWTPPPM